MSPGVVISDVMPSTPWIQDLVGHPERVDHRHRRIGHLEQAVVRHDDQRVDGLLQLGDADVGLGRALATLEAERPRDDADRERPEVAGDLGDDGRAAGAGAAALAGGDEHHVGALQDLLDLVGVLVGGALADDGVRAGAEPAGGLTSDVELHLGVGHQEGLRVGVDGDELDAPEACLDHPVHRVDAAPADADHLDDGEVVLGSIHRSSSPPGDLGRSPPAGEPMHSRRKFVPLRKASLSLDSSPHCSWPTACGPLLVLRAFLQPSQH